MTEITRADDGLDVLTSLAEPLRRRLYELVAGSSESVTRDAAAEALGVSRQVAAYHLDRMADDGLLEIEFKRLTGRSGPGAGRPAKLYRRSANEYAVTMPPRRYEVAARILLEAVGKGKGEQGDVTRVARRVGREMGGEGLASALREMGYEPVPGDGETCFRNCPFHELRSQDRDTTCGLNLALVRGMIEGSGSRVSATLVPSEEYCCVRISPALPEPGGRNRVGA